MKLAIIICRAWIGSHSTESHQENNDDSDSSQCDARRLAKTDKLLRNFFVTVATLTTKTEYSKSRKEIAERATRIINSKREIEKLKKTARKIVKL